MYDIQNKKQTSLFILTLAIFKESLYHIFTLLTLNQTREIKKGGIV